MHNQRASGSNLLGVPSYTVAECHAESHLICAKITEKRFASSASFGLQSAVSNTSRKKQCVMPANDNAHSLRLLESLRECDGEKAAQEVANHFPLSKSADVPKKFEWAKNICGYLEEHYSTEEIAAIRKKCRCNDGKSIAKKLLKYWQKAESTKDFVRLFNEGETFASLEYCSENKLHFCYPQCYCACVKREPQELPITWCYCTLGNAEGIFQEVF